MQDNDIVNHIQGTDLKLEALTNIAQLVLTVHKRALDFFIPVWGCSSHYLLNH